MRLSLRKLKSSMFYEILTEVAEAYSESRQTSKMERFAEIVDV